MITKEKILEMARLKGKIFTKDFTGDFGVSRQYANALIAQLVNSKGLLRIGSTKNAFYVLPEYAKNHPEILPTKYFKRFKNDKLEEHNVILEIEKKFPQFSGFKEHIRNIFTFAFSEMLNNAIEHSQSENISVEVSAINNELLFIVSDSGVGVFRSVMKKKKLKSELEAIQDLLKGKTTTMPKSHSGEGIFFTSKSGDVFILDSFGTQMNINNKTGDISARQVKSKIGTRVIFRINIDSQKHLSEVFKKYTNIKEPGAYGFDKTEIRVKLYTVGGVHISRSQARRILYGLEKFKIILFDFDNVPIVGQAFADEIYRVFHKKHPSIELQEINMSEAVKFMIDRAKTEAERAK